MKGPVSFAVILMIFTVTDLKYSAINTNIIKVYNDNTNIPLTKLHISSDGAGTQFRNRITTSTILQPIKMNPELKFIDWSFLLLHMGGPRQWCSRHCQVCCVKNNNKKRCFHNDC
jgi:hypothetical protein